MGPTEIGLAALIVVPFVTRYVGKIGDSFAEKNLEQVKEKFWQVIGRKPAGILPTLKSAETEASNVNFYQAAQELEAAANNDPEVKQVVSDVAEAIKQENPEYVKEQLEKVKLPGVTAEKINALLQQSTMSGGNIVETGTFVGSPEAFKGSTIYGGVEI